MQSLILPSYGEFHSLKEQNEECILVLLNTIKIYFWFFWLLPLAYSILACHVLCKWTPHMEWLSSAIALGPGLDSKSNCSTHLPHTSHIAKGCPTLTGPSLFLCHQSVWDIQYISYYVPTTGIRQGWCWYVAPLWELLCLCCGVC